MPVGGLLKTSCSEQETRTAASLSAGMLGRRNMSTVLIQQLGSLQLDAMMRSLSMRP